MSKGLFFSDRCDFCGEYSEKAAPGICVDCNTGIRKIVDSELAVVAKQRDACLKACERVQAYWRLGNFTRVSSLSEAVDAAIAMTKGDK